MTKKLLSRTALALAATALGASVLMPRQAQAQTPAELPAWLNKVTLGGDLRFRLQHTNDIANTNVDQAAVIRARIALIGNINESLTVNFRLASGSPSNTVSSSHQTLGETYDGYEKKPFWLDIASMDYKPFEGLVITAGKAVNPFYSGGKNELLYDGDVNPEGVNMKYSSELGALKPFAAVAYNVVSDTGTGSGSKQPDLTHAGGQIGAGYKAEAFGATLAAGYYVYNDVKGRGPVGIQTPANFRGNTNSGGTYATDFKLTNVEGELNFELGLPITAYGSYIDNSEADTEGTGMLGGLRLGKVAGPGTWSIDYNYRDLGGNAIIANFTDGDFGGQTNVYGHRVVAAYVPSPGLTVSAYGIFAERTNDSGVTQPWERFNLELLATF